MEAEKWAFKIFPVVNGGCYWQLIDEKGTIIVSSGRYQNTTQAIYTIDRIIRHTPRAEVVDLTKTERSQRAVKMPPMERDKIWDVDKWEKDWQNRRNDK